MTALDDDRTIARGWIAGADAISAASVMEDLPTRLGLSESRLDALP